MMATAVLTPARRTVMSPRDAADYLSMSERKLWSLTKQGEIPYSKIGRLVRYTIDDLDAFLAANRIAAR
jgi:excisionase family DNA binding protein